jgi:hypothetical protein
MNNALPVSLLVDYRQLLVTKRLQLGSLNGSVDSWFPWGNVLRQLRLGALLRLGGECLLTLVSIPTRPRSLLDTFCVLCRRLGLRIPLGPRPTLLRAAPACIPFLQQSLQCAARVRDFSEDYRPESVVRSCASHLPTSSRQVASASSSGSRLQSEYSLCKAAIGCTALARRKV